VKKGLLQSRSSSRSKSKKRDELSSDGKNTGDRHVKTPERVDKTPTAELDSVQKGLSQHESSITGESKMSDELSPKDKNAGDRDVISTPEHAAEASTAESDSVKKGLLHSQSPVRYKSKKGETAGETTARTAGHAAETSPAESVVMETVPPHDDASKKKLKQSDSGVGNNECDELSHNGNHNVIRTTGQADQTSQSDSVSVETFRTCKDASRKKRKQSVSSDGKTTDGKKSDEVLSNDRNADNHHDVEETGHSSPVKTFPPYKGASGKKTKRSDTGDGKTTDGKKSDEVLSNDKNADDHHDVDETGHSSPVKTFPPYKGASGKKTKRSDTRDGNSDGNKYARRVTICADGKEVISRVLRYSGNLVFPTVSGRVRKVQCPVCHKQFTHSRTLRNHAICEHNVINSGETLYSCMPCSYKTSNTYSFNKHRISKWHRSNLHHGIGNSDDVKPKPQTFTSLAALFAQQRAAESFYGSTAVVRPVEKQPPRVVWQGHLNHVCSSQCLSGLSTDEPSEDVALRTLRPRKSLDASAATVLPAASSIDTSNESKRLRSSDAQSQKKVAVGKSATPSPAETLKFENKKKGAASQPRNVDSISKTVKLPVTRSATNKSSSEMAISITDSDSDSKEVADVKPSRRVTRQSDFDKKQTSSHTSKPSMPSADKQKGSLLKKSADIGGSMKAKTSESTSPTGNQRTETLQTTAALNRSISANTLLSDLSPSGDMRSGSSVSSSAVGISQQNSCRPTTSIAVKMPTVVATVQQVSASHSSSIQVKNPVSAGSATLPAISSAAQRSVPVVGVAKAVQSVTATTQTTAAMNRSIYSLHRFSADTLWSELCRRGGMRSCDCGISFMDTTLYLLHRSCHSDLAPLKCAFCDHKSATCYDFHAHLLDHKK